MFMEFEGENQTRRASQQQSLGLRWSIRRHHHGNVPGTDRPRPRTESARADAQRLFGHGLQQGQVHAQPREGLACRPQTLLVHWYVKVEKSFINGFLRMHFFFSPGVFFGISIRTRKPISLNLAPMFWRMLLHRTIGHEDLEAIDLNYSRRQVNENCTGFALNRNFGRPDFLFPEQLS